MLSLLRSIRIVVPALALLTGVALGGCGEEDPADDVDDGNDERDAGGNADTGTKDAGADTGTKPTDSGQEPPEPGSSKSPYSGRYLIRFDTFGTATSSGFVIRSRASQLVTAVLTGEADELDAQERVCDQTALQKCMEGCSDASTVVDSRAVKDFMVQRTFARKYTVSGTTFEAGLGSYLLGYDDPKDGPLPSTTTDPRVWDVVKGDPREGLLSALTVMATEPFPVTIRCNLYGVAKFASTFKGSVEGSGDDAKFKEEELEANLDESDGLTLGSDNQLCASQDPSSPVDKATVRLLRVGDVPAKGEAWNCPTNAEFEAMLPGGAL